MAKQKKIFRQAVSEVKLFLLGAALVLTFVAIVPALAQSDTQAVIESGSEQVVAPAGDEEMKKVDEKFTKKDGKKSFEKDGKKSFEKDGKKSFEKDGKKLFEKEEKKLLKKDEKKLLKKDGKKSSKKDDEKFKKDFEGKKLGDGESSAKKKPAFNIPKLDLSELEEESSAVLAVEAVDGQLITPFLSAIESNLLKGKKGLKTAVKQVKQITRTADQICSAFEEDSDECLELYKNFTAGIKGVETLSDFEETLNDFLSGLKNLAGIDEAFEDEASEDEDFEDEDFEIEE